MSEDAYVYTALDRRGIRVRAGDVVSILYLHPHAHDDHGPRMAEVARRRVLDFTRDHGHTVDPHTIRVHTVTPDELRTAWLATNPADAAPREWYAILAHWTPRLNLVTDGAIA